MKPQTADNLRCLAAAVFVFAVFGVFLVTPGHADWFFSLPDSIKIVGSLALLLLAVHLFNFRRTVKTDRVLFDNLMITNSSADGETKSVRWDDLQEVGILTTDDGPWAEDVYWILLGANSRCAVSGGAQGMKELLLRLQQLPGFNNEAVIKAMGSTTHNKFVCWKHPSDSPKGGLNTG
jgi:hypothetical protein